MILQHHVDSQRATEGAAQKCSHISFISQIVVLLIFPSLSSLLISQFLVDALARGDTLWVTQVEKERNVELGLY